MICFSIVLKMVKSLYYPHITSNYAEVIGYRWFDNVFVVTHRINDFCPYAKIACVYITPIIIPSYGKY